LAEGDFVEPAVDLRVDVDGLVRGHRAQAVEIDRDVAHRRVGGDDRDHPFGGARPAALRAAGRLLSVPAPAQDGADDQGNENAEAGRGPGADATAHRAPSAASSCARADPSPKRACTACAAAVVKATCASSSSMTLPSTCLWRASASDSWSRALTSASSAAVMVAFAACTPRRACST